MENGPYHATTCSNSKKSLQKVVICYGFGYSRKQTEIAAIYMLGAISRILAKGCGRAGHSKTGKWMFGLVLLYEASGGRLDVWCMRGLSMKAGNHGTSYATRLVICQESNGMNRISWNRSRHAPAGW
jgi:hypothetical protein